MKPFVRFIFAILAVGIAANLSVVFVANAQSQRRQFIQDDQNKNQLADLLVNFDKSLRRADIAVESQRVDHDGIAIESTLLVRQYHSTGSDQSMPLPVRRVTIGGDRLAVYGVMLEFNDLFADDAPEFRILRGKQLVYFSYVCAENEKPPANQPDERFTLMPLWQPPELTRLDTSTARPTIYEVRLWKYVWNRISDEQHPLPWNSGWKNNVNATFMTPAVVSVQLHHTYSAWINGNSTTGTLSLGDETGNLNGIPRLTEAMVEQMKGQEAQTRPAPATTSQVLRLP